MTEKTEAKQKRPEWEYITPPRSEDRKEEERLMAEEERVRQERREAEKLRPPSFDTPGAPAPVDPETGEPVELAPGRPKDSTMPGRNPPRPYVPMKGALDD